MPKAKLDLRPSTLDLELYAGDGVHIQLTVTNNAGEPIPVEGEITAQIRKERLDDEHLAEFNADLTDAATGIVTISLSGIQTAALTETEALFDGAWDVQWEEPDNEPITLLQGRVKCHVDVTR